MFGKSKAKPTFNRRMRLFKLLARTMIQNQYRLGYRINRNKKWNKLKALAISYYITESNLDKPITKLQILKRL